MDDCIINVKQEYFHEKRGIPPKSIHGKDHKDTWKGIHSEDTSVKKAKIDTIPLKMRTKQTRRTKKVNPTAIPCTISTGDYSKTGASKKTENHSEIGRNKSKLKTNSLRKARTIQDAGIQLHQVPRKPNLLTDNDGRESLSFPSHMKCDGTKQVDLPRPENVTNPLQSKFNSANTSSKDTINNLMSSVVSSNIESVFSRKTWSKYCAEAGIHSHLSSCLLDRFKVERLTSIQDATMPALLSGQDGLVRAQTGSGKTLAYAVPLLNQLICMEPPVSRLDGPLALIILPTRELATQTFDVFHNLVHACVRIVPACLIGGTKRKAQKASLRKGVNIVIGTPQRLMDHIIRTASLHMNRLKWLVIDEADRLLEMGFEHSVRQIMDHINQVRNADGNGTEACRLQTVLLSATLTEGVEKLAGLALHSPAHCTVGDTSAGRRGGSQGGHDDVGQFSMPSGLRHYLLLVPWKLRLVSLAAFMLLKCRYHKNGGKLIIFMATQDCVDFHHQLFKTVLCPDDEELLNVVSSDVSSLLLFRLHGNMLHSERQSVFHKFATSVSGILFTTDVASRGLDLAGVAWVVQYHVTGGPVDYVHRVGRTARAGGKGKALLFLDPGALGFAHFLTDRFGVPFERQQLSLPDLLQTVLFHLQHTRRSGTGQHRTQSTTVEESASRFAYLFMDAVSEDTVLSPLAESAYISFIRSYASLSGELRAFFTFKNLHLGHVAKAFCLKVTPSEVARRVTGKRHRADEGSGTRRQAGQRKRSVGPQEGDQVPSAKLDFGAVRPDELPRKSRQHAKPAGRDKARQNMLAEYGL